MRKTNKSKKTNTQLKKPFQVVGKNADKFDKLKMMILDLGDWNINYNHFATESGIPNQTVYHWKDKVLSEMPPINPTLFGSKMIAATESAIRQCQLHIRTAPTFGDKARFMSVLCGLNQSLTDVYEKYGLKEKVADKHLIFGSNKIEVTFVDPDEDEQIDEKMNDGAKK
jgi:hypothetical protein